MCACVSVCVCVKVVVCCFYCSTLYSATLSRHNFSHFTYFAMAFVTNFIIAACIFISFSVFDASAYILCLHKKKKKKKIAEFFLCVMVFVIIITVVGCFVFALLPTLLHEKQKEMEEKVEAKEI